MAFISVEPYDVLHRGVIDFQPLRHDGSKTVSHRTLAQHHQWVFSLQLSSQGFGEMVQQEGHLEEET